MGEVHRTGDFHALTPTADDVESFLAEVGKAAEEKPGALNILSHIEAGLIRLRQQHCRRAAAVATQPAVQREE